MVDSDQSGNIVLLYKYVEVGGVATYLKTLAKVCTQHQYNMYLVTAVDDRNREFITTLSGSGLHVLPVTFTRNNLLLAVRFWKALAKNHRKYHFDIIHSHHRLSHVLGKLFSRKYGIPLLLSVHEFKDDQKMLTNYWKNEPTTVPSNALKDHLVERYAARADSLHVISNAITEDIEVDEQRLRTLKESLFQDKNKLYIGYLGRLAYEKGIDILLESMAIVRAQNPNIGLRIFGTGPCEHELENRCRELGLNTEMIFRGLCTDVNEILSLVDICVSPSRSESFSIFSLETMRAGKPMVASEVGGIPEVVSNNETGLLVEPESPEALADALLKLADDTELRKKLGRRAQIVFKEEFSSTRFFFKHQELYRQLRNEKHA